MRDERKSEGELLGELDALRRHVSELEQAQSAPRHSEKQLKDLFDNAIVGIYRTTPDGRIIMANSAFVRMLGFSSFEELAEKKVDDEGFAPGYPRPTFKDLIEKKGKVIGFESAFLRRDGTTIFVRENARVVLDLSGRVLYYEGVVEDITEHKRTEEDVKILKQQIEFILGATKTGLDIIDSGFNIRFIDPAWGKVYGEPNGKKCYEYFMGRSNVCPGCGIIKALETKKITIAEQVLVKENNRPIQVTTIPFQNEKGEWLVAEVNVDVTERKRTEDALRDSEEKVQAILNATTESVLLLDKRGIFLVINKTAAQRFGRSVEEIVGLSAWDAASGLASPELLKSRTEHIDKVIRSGKPVRFEDERKGIIFDTSIYPIFDTDGKVSRVAIFGRDITKQRRAEQAMREAKLRYQTLFESAPIGIGVATRDGRVLECNDAMLKMTGYSEAEIKQINLRDTYQDPQQRQELLKRLERDGFIRGFEVQLKRKDGTLYYASLTITPFTLDGQNVRLTVQEDITEHKLAAEILEKSESKYRSLLENLPQRIFLKDTNSVYVSCNENYARDMKIKPEEIAGKTDYDFYSKKLAEKYRSDDKRIMEGGKTENIEEKYIQGGQELIVRTVKTPVKDAKGRVSGILGIFWDITKEKRSQEELQKYREKMIRAKQLASLGTLGATLVHEITQPLTVITLSIENALTKLKTMSCSATVTRKLKDSLAGASSITSIVERFRNDARKSSEGITEEVKLKPVAERTVRFLSESARRARVTLRLKGLDKLPPVYSSEKDMEQLFFALIENAIQAATGKKDRQVVISGDVEGDYVQLRFADNCGGIAPENLGKIFELFFTTKPPGEGTGLGLCIVEHVVSRAGGKVRVESKAGKGSTFFVTLPINAGEKS
jgi:PAS domain S-box-containing protein